MTALETHLNFTIPLVVAVVGGIWLWGKWERWRDDALYLETGEEPFPGAWPLDVQAGSDEPAKLTREQELSVSP